MRQQDWAPAFQGEGGFLPSHQGTRCELRERGEVGSRLASIMPRTTSTLTISLPPAMLAELERVRKAEHRTRSELLREALRTYFSSRIPIDPDRRLVIVHDIRKTSTTY